MNRFFLLIATIAVLASSCSKDKSPTGVDPVGPVITSTLPSNGASGVLQTSTITATFDTAMDPATLNTTSFLLKNGSVIVPATVSYASNVATLVPSSQLDQNVIYTASISTAATDMGSRPLAAGTTWSFTTAGSGPSVVSTTPVDGANGVLATTSVTATFDTPMQPATLTAATFQLKNGATLVPANVSYAGNVATLIPSAALTASVNYTASISTVAKNLAGTPLAVTKIWSFTVSSSAPAGPSAVNLGTAGTFTILAKSGISTTGTTLVTGDIGLSPVAAVGIAGFGLTAPPTTFTTSALVTGHVFASDYDPPTPANLTTAVLDMQNAYTDAAGRTLPDFTELGAGNIAGLTLVPGLYKWGTSLDVPSSVTLSGGANAVWIFQIAGNLTVGNAVVVNLIGGAQAKNIFWQVAGQTTLGTTSNFKGNILCQTLIAMNAGSTVLGRALAQTAVTMNATRITLP